jgi:hypothetical protein
MRVYSAEITINASAEDIWQILTDGQGYPDWDPGMERVEGTFARGEKISFFTKLSPDRAFPVTVTTFVSGEKMVLTGGMPLGLFKSERTHTLTPEGEGSIKFTTSEVFSGPLLPVFGRTIPDLTPNFEDFVAGLKARAEE